LYEESPAYGGYVPMEQVLINASIAQPVALVGGILGTFWSGTPEGKQAVDRFVESVVDSVRPLPYRSRQEAEKYNLLEMLLFTFATVMVPAALETAAAEVLEAPEAANAGSK